MAGALCFAVCQCDSPLTPALSPKGARGKGSRSPGLSKPEFDSVSQVGATCTFSAVSSLYLWERVRVRAVGNIKI
jgi:hypothetical protein